VVGDVDAPEQRRGIRHHVGPMRIAVAGGTGTIGRHIVAALSRDGHEVRALSRNADQYPVDLTTGAGLDAALAGCDVVIDASNGPSRKARAVLVEGSHRMLDVGARAGVRHHVCVSIVGIEDLPIGYYGVKLEQERVVERASLPWTIVRSTQFHDLLGAVMSAADRWRVLPVPRAQLQPVGVHEVADAVAAVSIDAPRLARVAVGGPEVLDLRSLGRIWQAAGGHRAIEIPIPLPGKSVALYGRGD
jgi:uncharacterized protein YbjT (DUF2867 family)